MSIPMLGVVTDVMDKMFGTARAQALQLFAKTTTTPAATTTPTATLVPIQNEQPVVAQHVDVYCNVPPWYWIAILIICFATLCSLPLILGILATKGFFANACVKSPKKILEWMKTFKHGKKNSQASRPDTAQLPEDMSSEEAPGESLGNVEASVPKQKKPSKGGDGTMKRKLNNTYVLVDTLFIAINVVALPLILRVSMAILANTGRWTFTHVQIFIIVICLIILTSINLLLFFQRTRSKSLHSIKSSATERPKQRDYKLDIIAFLLSVSIPVGVMAMPQFILSRYMPNVKTTDQWMYAVSYLANASLVCLIILISIDLLPFTPRTRASISAGCRAAVQEWKSYPKNDNSTADHGAKKELIEGQSTTVTVEAADGVVVVEKWAEGTDPPTGSNTNQNCDAVDTEHAKAQEGRDGETLTSEVEYMSLTESDTETESEDEDKPDLRDDGAEGWMNVDVL